MVLGCSICELKARHIHFSGGHIAPRRAVRVSGLEHAGKAQCSTQHPKTSTQLQQAPRLGAHKAWPHEGTLVSFEQSQP